MRELLGELLVDGVCKDYPSRGAKPLRAVDDVGFGASRGEICVLLGPSGCGKSTILRMVAGLESITAGRVSLSGRPVTGPGGDRGMVFQSYTSFPWLTVRQNVGYGLRVNGKVLSEREGTVDYFLDRVKLTPFQNAYPDQLSGGMRQRVAIARTLANGPELLLMDEPFGALDTETRWQMQELLLDVVTKERMTVLMVTHDVDEALFLADRIVFLSSHPGRVKEVITPNLRQRMSEPSKEALYAVPEFSELERRIVRLMREASRESESA